MFGCICAGRLVQTNLQRVDETSFVFAIERANEVNHMTVFLLGSEPFPPGYAGSVYFQFPGREFIPLGILSNDRPSAIYRIRALQQHPPLNHSDPSSSTSTATLGIQIVPLDQAQGLAASISAKGGSVTDASAAAGGPGAGAMVPAGQGQGQGMPSVGVIAEKIVKNLFHYLHSFEGAPATLTPDTAIPLGVFQKWYDNFLGKVKRDNGASFLARED